MARITMRNSQKATFAEVFEIYISAVTARGVKDNTIATYKQHFHAISMLGSNPARITNMIRYSSGSRGQSAKLLIAGWRQKLQPIKCNCPVGSCSRRLDGAKPLFSHKRKCKSNPARISIWSLRLVGQDASLSSWKYGFESRRDHQTVRHIGISQIESTASTNCFGFSE